MKHLLIMVVGFFLVEWYSYPSCSVSGMTCMKILGVDEYRSRRFNGVLTYFELEGVPNPEWVQIFERLVHNTANKIWVEGYCIVIDMIKNDAAQQLEFLQSKCDETTEKLKHSQNCL
ncbi:hypothetical protein SAMN04487773_1045 [Enterobacter sp. kpr-6]|nr:hypothetical protein SAMN04487773_1045 [Enterobacter sp. kpr-6]